LSGDVTPVARGKIRLDELLVLRELAPSRTRAQALILAGRVYAGETRLNKPGMSLAIDAAIQLRGDDHPYVSRGGLKLEHALEAFSIDPAGMVALDIGASTGGFTDLLLQRGAARVYAVDVGHGQLAWSLRQDPRVVVRERVNARYLKPEDFAEPIAMIVTDASFIGLSTLLPAALALAAPGAILVALIKPQFEVGKALVGKGGVVRDPALHDQVRRRIADWLARDMGWEVFGEAESPILGPAGNREFLIAARKSGDLPSPG
jgi:23S rRNA (cytidine1920-2'-O)/16S rRNA (cytidine1409-2'-O)-methyltransferase